MSDTTTVIVSILPPCTSLSADSPEYIDFWEKSVEWLESQAEANWDKQAKQYEGFEEISSNFGGSKVPPPEVWTGCFTGFDEAAFLQFVRSLPWIDPSKVQVLIMGETGENADKWRVFEVDTKPTAPCNPPEDQRSLNPVNTFSRKYWKDVLG